VLADETAGGKIQVRIPNGWTAEALKVDQADAVVLIAPDYDRTSAACLLASADDASSSGQAQQDLNAAAEAIANDAFWNDYFKRPSVSNIVIIATGSKTRAGRSVPFAKASYTDADDGAIIAKDALQLVPGRMLIVDCTAKAAAYPAAEASCDVVASLPRPSGQVAFVKKTPPSAAFQALVNQARTRLRQTATHQRQ
jgi:hypothetical protein